MFNASEFIDNALDDRWQDRLAGGEVSVEQLLNWLHNLANDGDIPQPEEPDEWLAVRRELESHTR